MARVRRQECPDGTYEHEGRQCCMCAAGSRVEKHCTDKLQTQCEPCSSGEYQSLANEGTTCEKCRSCTQPNTNLEVDRRCTRYVDSTCKCKENHYCSSGTTPCKACAPCQVCGPEGEKVACSATNNTICNDKSQDNTLGIALGIIIPLLAVAGALVGYFLWKKRNSASRKNENGRVESAEASVPLQPAELKLPESLRPHIPGIAEVIGWTPMRNLAMNSKIPEGRIQSCMDNHPKDSVEATIALMKIWEEKESKNAGPKLIQYLKQNNQNSTVEEVLKILRVGSQ